MLSLLLISRAFAAAPARILVPRAKMQITHSRSSGPGGQNVNKVNTKVELRFNVREAEWLNDEVRARLEEAQKNRINKEGELIVSASESRSQASNFQSALDKIQAMVDEACIPPKERHAWVGLAETTKRMRVEDKRRTSQVKQNRARVDY